MSGVYEIKSFRGGIADYEDKGTPGSFKHGANLDIRKRVDSISAGQALKDLGLESDNSSPSASTSPSASVSPSLSASVTPSPSASTSPSGSVSSSQSASSGTSPSPSLSASVSVSLSASPTPSISTSLSPSPSGGLTTIFADLVKWWVKASDGYTYGFGDAGYIYRVDADLGVTRVYKDANGAIKGAEEKPSSTSSGGVKYLQWATDNHIKQKPIPGLNNWNDVTVVTGNLSSADYHTMKQVGGALHVANVSKLALVGYDNSYTSEALNLIPGNIAKTIIERKGRSIIGTYSAGNSAGAVNGAIDLEYPIAQIGDDGELFFNNGIDKVPFKRFQGGGKVNPGGVAPVLDRNSFFEWEETALSWIDKQEIVGMGLFAVYSADSGKGGVFTVGRKNKNHPFVVNLEYQLDADELGAVVQQNANVMMVSYKDGSDYGVKATDVNNKAEGIYEGLDLKAPVKKPINVTTWPMVHLLMKPLPTGTWVEFWYKTDKTGSFVRAKTADNDTKFDIALAKEAVFRVMVKGSIFEPRVLVHPYGNTTPEVYKIIVHFN